MDFEKLSREELLQMLKKLVGEEPKAEPKAEPKLGRKWGIGDLYPIRDEMVRVKSIQDAKVIYLDRATSSKYVWHSKGDELWIRIEVLQRMYYQKLYFDKLYLKLDDERLIQAFQLEEKYKALDKVEDIEKLVLEGDIDEIRNILSLVGRDYAEYIRCNALKIMRANKNTLSLIRYKQLMEIFRFQEIDMED